MRGKVNPVIPEMVTQVAFQVMCFDQAITLAAASGQLELNAFLPLIAFNILTSLRLLIKAVNILRTHCVEGIRANEERCRHWLEESLCLTTALAPYIGYGEAANLYKQAATTGKTIQEVAVENGLFKAEELAVIFSPAELTRPGIAGARKLKYKLKKKE
jgi:aspartate ammonia-lyase